jgi:hypothetical protein
VLSLSLDELSRCPGLGVQVGVLSFCVGWVYPCEGVGPIQASEVLCATGSEPESLILAQNERWRHA